MAPETEARIAALEARVEALERAPEERAALRAAVQEAMAREIANRIERCRRYGAFGSAGPEIRTFGLRARRDDPPQAETTGDR